MGDSLRGVFLMIPLVELGDRHYKNMGIKDDCTAMQSDFEKCDWNDFYPDNIHDDGQHLTDEQWLSKLNPQKLAQRDPDEVDDEDFPELPFSAELNAYLKHVGVSEKAFKQRIKTDFDIISKYLDGVHKVAAGTKFWKFWDNLVKTEKADIFAQGNVHRKQELLSLKDAKKKIFKVFTPRKFGYRFTEYVKFFDTAYSRSMKDHQDNLVDFYAEDIIGRKRAKQVEVGKVKVIGPDAFYDSKIQQDSNYFAVKI